MVNTLLGIKKGMTSGYDSRGRRVGATVVEVSPNFITQVKSTEGKDKYQALQLGISFKKQVKKPQVGHLKKAGVAENISYLKEIRVEQVDDVKPGQELKVGEIFAVGDAVKITGVSRGKGFAGVVKRYGFAGGPKTHGQSDRHRAPGSIGAGTTPGRVYKGKKMAGHMGVENVTYKNLEVIAVDKSNNLLTIKGGIPGYTGGAVVIQRLGRIKGYTPPPEEKVDEDEEEKTSETVDKQVGGSENSESQENEEVKENAKG